MDISSANDYFGVFFRYISHGEHTFAPLNARDNNVAFTHKGNRWLTLYLKLVTVN